MIREIKSLINLLHRQVKSCISPFSFSVVFRASATLCCQSYTYPVLNEFSPMSSCPLTYRCWELTHQNWLQRPPRSLLTCPISLMSYSPAMSFFNISKSSVIGHTEHFSASSPKYLQCNDDPSAFAILLSITWLQSGEDTRSPTIAKWELRPYQCAL